MGPRANAGVRVSGNLSAKLEQMIVTGELPEGACLPPEREFAVQLGVSRGSWRGGVRRRGLSTEMTAGQSSRRAGRLAAGAPAG